MSDPSFLLGEYGARLGTLEEHVRRIDHNVAFLVTRETERATSERHAKAVLATAGGFFGAIFAFIASTLQKWLLS